MRHLTLALLGGVLLAGCASNAPMWMLYGRAQYLYGRIEALGEVHCKVPIPVDRQAVCAEAARLQVQMREVKPVIDAELSKSEPDWARLLPYIDLVLGAVGKVALIP